MMSDVNVHPQHHLSNHQLKNKTINPLVDCNGKCSYNANSFIKSPTMPVIMSSASDKHGHSAANSSSNPNISKSSAMCCCGCCDESSSHPTVSCINCSQYPAGHTLAMSAAATHPFIARSQPDVTKFDDEKLRKRMYRIGLNLFNKKEERGIQFLIQNGFIDLNPCTPSSSCAGSSFTSSSSSSSSSATHASQQPKKLPATVDAHDNTSHELSATTSQPSDSYPRADCHAVTAESTAVSQNVNNGHNSAKATHQSCSSSSSSSASSTITSSSCSTLSADSAVCEESNCKCFTSSATVSTCPIAKSTGPVTISATTRPTEASVTNAGVTTNNYQDLLAASVAQFLLTRKGLSKEKIGTYLGNLRNAFNQRVLDFFVSNFNFAGMAVDQALRKFQGTFRFPGETQQIERLVEKFAARYVECNCDFACKRKARITTSDSLDGSAGDSISSSLSIHQSSSTSDLSYSATSTSSSSTCSSASLALPEHFSSSSSSGSQVKDEVFVLSFAIIMLNTDLHTPNNKVRMTCDQWIKNLKGMFPGGDLTDSYLTEIYDRIKLHELKTGADHVTQVMKVQQQLVPGNKKLTSTLPNLPVPVRRLVCFCRLFEVPDVNKKEKPGQHLRDVFLFNDILLVTKAVTSSSKKILISSNLPSMTSNSGLGESRSSSHVNSVNSPVYSYRGIYHLFGLSVKTFSTDLHPFAIKLIRKADQVDLLTFDAKSDYDRSRFVEDLRESIEEVDLMEAVESRSFQHLLYLHMRNSPHIGYHPHNSLASLLASHVQTTDSS